MSEGSSGLTINSVLISKVPSGPDKLGTASLFSADLSLLKNVSVFGYTPTAVHVRVKLEGDLDEGGDSQSSSLMHDMSIAKGSA